MKDLFTLLVCTAICQQALAQCVSSAYTFLEVNNVTAPVDNDGSIGYLDNPETRYSIDTGSGDMTSFLAVGLWVAGLDDNDQLHLAAMKYGQTGDDYFPGPLSTTTAQTDPFVCAEYDRLWKLDRWRVEEFFARQGQPGYLIPQELLTWPAHGDLNLGHDYNLAPYYDADGSGYYDPEDGDYPLFDLNGSFSPSSPPFKLEGDQSIWWVMNDAGGAHTESGGEPIGIEVRCVAYGLDRCDALGNTTFYRYQIINRGSLTLHDTYVGLWVDPDALNSLDDYVQCDVTRNMGFVYDALSGPGNGTGFGVDLLHGPYAPLNGVDDDNNGIVDDEHLRMGKFMTGGLGEDPSTPALHYTALKGLYGNGTSVCYGGNGHLSNGCNGIDASYMFPGSSDPTGIGTGGLPQTAWTEGLVGNAPGERRFLMSAGPFTLEPGAIHDIHYAAVWANDPLGGDPVGALEAADDAVQAAFDGGFQNLPCCPPKAQIHLDQPSVDQFFFSSVSAADQYQWNFGDGNTSTDRFPYPHTYADGQIHEVMLVVSNSCGSDTAYMDAGSIFFGVEEEEATAFRVFPNPSSDQLTVSFKDSGLRGTLEVRNMLGQLVHQQAVNDQSTVQVQTSWPAGNYMLLFRTDDAISVQRFSVVN